MTHITQIDVIKKQRGKRIRDLRESLFLTRRKFAEKHQLSYSTLQNWEDGRFGGLTEKGALLLVTLFAESGLRTSFEWIYDGEGPDPVLTIHKTSPTSKLIDQHIQDELNLFKHHNKLTLHTKLHSNSMQPRFNKGDLVAGIVKPLHCLEQFYNVDCILVKKDGHMLVGRLIHTGCHSKEILEILQINTATIEKIAINAIVEFAPIIWIRATL